MRQRLRHGVTSHHRLDRVHRCCKLDVFGLFRVELQSIYLKPNMHTNRAVLKFLSCATFTGRFVFNVAMWMSVSSTFWRWVMPYERMSSDKVDIYREKVSVKSWPLWDASFKGLNSWWNLLPANECWTRLEVRTDRLVTPNEWYSRLVMTAQSNAADWSRSLVVWSDDGETCENIVGHLFVYCPTSSVHRIHYRL